MAVPKRRVSHARRDKRRSNVWKMDAPTLVKCPNCGELLARAVGSTMADRFSRLTTRHNFMRLLS